MRTIFINDEFQEIIDQLQAEKKNGNYAEVKKLADVLEKQAIKSNNKYAQVLSYYFHSVCGLYYNIPIETKEYCFKAKEICREYEYYKLYTLLCMIEGSAYVYLNERQSAIGSLLEGYYLSLKHSLKDISAHILNNIGSIFSDLENYETGLEYYIKASEIMKELPDSDKMGHLILHINIVNNYVHQGKFDKAIEWEKKYLSDENDRAIPVIKNSLIVCHILMEYKQDTKEELERKVNEFLEYVQCSNIDTHFIRVVFNIIECCYDIKNIELAKKIIMVIEPTIEKCDAYDYKERLLYAKSQLWEILGDKKALYEDLLKYREVVSEGKMVKQENECAGLLSQIQLQEIEEKRKQIEIRNKELKRQSELDSFTGLLNKVSFRNKVEDRLKKKNRNVSRDILVLVDIDDFKKVNDVYGHIAGDTIIKDMAKLLKSKARNVDYVGRIGGDEFCILLVEIYSKESIKNWIESLIEGIHSLEFKDLEDVKITVSVGAAPIEEGMDYTHAFEQVDKAMYGAKKKGKNTYQIYES